MIADLPFLAAQAWLLGAGLVCGFAGGLAWRGYQRLLRSRGLHRRQRKLLWLRDSLFGLLTALGLLLLWLLLSGGRLRPAVFLWLAVGAYLAQLPPPLTWRRRPRPAAKKPPTLSPWPHKKTPPASPRSSRPLLYSRAVARCCLRWQKRLRTALRRQPATAEQESDHNI